MNITPQEARAELGEALKTVDGVRFFEDISATVDPPSSTIGPPALTWEAHCSGPPTAATFVVYLMVAVSDRAVDRLLELLPAVTAAIENVPDAVVRSATPGVWIGGGPELPSYEILTEVAL